MTLVWVHNIVLMIIDRLISSYQVIAQVHQFGHNTTWWLCWLFASLGLRLLQAISWAVEYVANTHDYKEYAASILFYLTCNQFTLSCVLFPFMVVQHIYVQISMLEFLYWSFYEFNTNFTIMSANPEWWGVSTHENVPSPLAIYLCPALKFWNPIVSRFTFLLQFCLKRSQWFLWTAPPDPALLLCIFKSLSWSQLKNSLLKLSICHHTQKPKVQFSRKNAEIFKMPTPSHLKTHLQYWLTQ